jgi:hypothetical protein
MSDLKLELVFTVGIKDQPPCCCQTQGKHSTPIGRHTMIPIGKGLAVQPQKAFVKRRSVLSESQSNLGLVSGSCSFGVGFNKSGGSGRNTYSKHMLPRSSCCKRGVSASFSDIAKSKEKVSEEEKDDDMTIDEYMKEASQTLSVLGIGIEQFKVVEHSIGRGTYGLVKLVEREGIKYAMKQVAKDEITKVRVVAFLTGLNSLGRWKVYSESRSFSKSWTTPLFQSFSARFRYALRFSEINLLGLRKLILHLRVYPKWLISIALRALGRQTIVLACQNLLGLSRPRFRISSLYEHHPS